MTDVSYSIYIQPDWLSSSDASFSVAQSTYNNGAFGRETGAFSGYIGSDVILAGYDAEKNVEGQGSYIIDTYGSVLGGMIEEPSGTDPPQEIGYLYYLKSTRAQIYVPQELRDAEGFNYAEALIDSWNETNAGSNYTSISGRNDRYVYVNGTSNSGSALSFPQTVTIDGVEREFLGWKVLDTSSGSPADGLTTDELILYDYTSSRGNSNVGAGTYTPSSIDLYELGSGSVTGGEEVWDAIFGNGTTEGSGNLILVPYYAAQYGEIGSVTNATRTAAVDSYRGEQRLR
ncbi:MAG TPA: hypothetical protein IAC50_08685 [Candidatus Copromorpha excrementigallinarum]|uniref:Uncharacterized protein n=1 Tax=Candidatus Allocopromorpha excrementigallinarum TaxID=2840742 RepID=A0A9D1I1A6_9FIRM|nr:hypothetical protein [Candidatus Copromorpha excrementigallinarum]